MIRPNNKKHKFLESYFSFAAMSFWVVSLNLRDSFNSKSGYVRTKLNEHTEKPLFINYIALSRIYKILLHFGLSRFSFNGLSILELEIPILLSK